MAARQDVAAGSVTGARALAAVLCLLGALRAPSAASAGQFPVFGPQVFQTEASLTVLAAHPGPGYVLRVEAVEPGTQPRFNVRLNRTLVVGRDESQETPLPLEAPVTLAARNALTVKVMAGRGAIRLSILGVDEKPPTIVALAAPRANAAGWQTAPITVRFVCADDRSGLELCTPPVAVRQEGAGQIISGTARDRAGNFATAEIRLSLDWTPPTVVLTAPADGLETGDTEVEVAGIVRDAGGVATVEVASLGISTGAPADPDGRFSRTVLLRDGENPIRVSVRDPAGNVTTVDRRVVLVPAPSVVIAAPAAAALTREPTVEVRGTARGAVSVEVEGVEAVLSQGTFVASGVPLREGSNTLTAVARDRRGRQATASVLVTRDSTPPRVAVHAPSPGSTVTAESVTVTGMVNDLILGSVDTSEPAVQVNGVPAEVDNRNFLARNVPLAPGENTLTAVATDLAGNVSQPASVTVRRIVPIPGRPLLSAVAGDLQEGTAGAELSAPLEVELLDADGKPLAGKPVLFHVAENDGAVQAGEGSPPGPSALATTDAAGRARASWRLGQRAGPGRNRVEATAEGAPGAVSFAASGRPGTAAALVLDGGNRQRGLAGKRLPAPLVVVATDAGHNRLEGVPVTFRVTAGGGSLDGHDTVTVATDVYGRALAWLTLGPEPGIESNAVEAGFPGNPGSPVAFHATGELAGDPADTRVSGVVLDGTDRPIEGVTARLEETGLTTRTDAGGQFTLGPVPVGTVRLIVDGSTAERDGSWPSLEYQMVTVPGRDNRLERPVYLLPLDLAHGVFVDETRGGTVSLPELPGFALEIAPGSATFPTGSRSGVVSVTPVHADKIPMVPNFGQQPRLVVTIQPSGVRFDPPARLSMPNVDGLPPNQVTEMYSFDHQLGMFVSIGTGTVSADGSVIRSDPGMGVVEGGWHCSGNPAASGSAEPVKVEIPAFQKGKTIAVGETVSLSGSGTPAEGTYSWKTGGGLRIAGASDSSSVTVAGEAPGASKAQVTYKCKYTDAWDTDDADVNVIGVEIAGIDVCRGEIRTRLLGVGSGVLTLKLGDTTILSATRSAGDQTDSLHLELLPPNTRVTSVQATWKVDDATATAGKETDFTTLGVLRHFLVNLPDESHPSCQGPPDGEAVSACLIREVEEECLLCQPGQKADSEKVCDFPPIRLQRRFAEKLTDFSPRGRTVASEKGCIEPTTPDECEAKGQGPRKGECDAIEDVVVFWKEVECDALPVGTVVAPKSLSSFVEPGSKLCINPGFDGLERTVSNLSEDVLDGTLEHISASGACNLDPEAFPPSVTIVLPDGGKTQ